MSDHTLEHLLSRRQLKRSNRCANLARNICLIIAITTIIFCLIFQASLERALSEATRFISLSQTCVDLGSDLGKEQLSQSSIPSFKDLERISKDHHSYLPVVSEQLFYF